MSNMATAIPVVLMPGQGEGPVNGGIGMQPTVFARPMGPGGPRGPIPVVGLAGAQLNGCGGCGLGGPSFGKGNPGKGGPGGPGGCGGCGCGPGAPGGPGGPGGPGPRSGGSQAKDFFSRGPPDGPGCGGGGGCGPGPAMNGCHGPGMNWPPGPGMNGCHGPGMNGFQGQGMQGMMNGKGPGMNGCMDFGGKGGPEGQQMAYMPVIVPASQMGQYQSSGAVPLACVNAEDLKSGEVLNEIYAKMPEMLQEKTMRGSSKSPPRGPETWRFNREGGKGKGFDRRPSLEGFGRQSDEPRMPRDRRPSPERGPFQSRRRNFGVPDRPLKFGGSQQSGQWQQPLPNGSPASVYFIADQTNLQQAASRLNFLGQGLVIVMDCHGWNLKTAAGKLCLLTVAFMDGNLQVFIFDVVQLGEQMHILAPFFTNPNATKISSDASTHAEVLAHKFGINLTGVIDAQWAYETVEKRTMVKPVEILEWCGMAPMDYKNEAERLAGNPEIWGQRPLSQPVLSHATQGICLQHAAANVMWEHLGRAFGPTAFNKVIMNSQRRAEMAAAAGWACRNAGLYTAEQDYQKESDLDDWLAKRFGRQEPGAPPSAAVRARSADKPKLPETAFREGDSPRTAAWRAAVAELNPPRIQPSRQRSASPTLNNWLSRRDERRANARPGASHRASSLPSRERERADDEEDYFPRPLQPLNFDNLDRKRWTEIVEEDHAHAGD